MVFEKENDSTLQLASRLFHLIDNIQYNGQCSYLTRTATFLSSHNLSIKMSIIYSTKIQSREKKDERYYVQEMEHWKI